VSGFFLFCEINKLTITKLFANMKKELLFVLLCLGASFLMAQVPQAFKYQAVARDLNGDLLMNQPVSFKISILQGSASGTAVYVETHTSMTNDYGLVNLEIGNGTVVSGSFSAIDWGGDSHYLKVEMDPAGGTLYQAMGTSQLLSVPYALQSGDSPPDDDWTITGNNLYSAVTGNVGIGTSSPETDLSVFSDASNQGLTLQTSDNTFNQGIRFRNSGGAYTWHIFRKDAGSNNADLVFANGASTDITALTDRIVFKNGGKVGIGTSAPGQQLTVIGTVRGSNDAAQTEYVEMSHGGGNGFINWTGDGNLEFRYSGTALANVVQTGGFNITAGKAYMIGGNNILHNEGAQNLFVGYQAGLNNTGGAATFIGFQTGISGNSGNYNTFVGSKAGQQNLSGSDNAFIGNEAGQQNSTGGGNVFVGSAAGDGSTTGSGNVFVGNWAGSLNATGNNNTMIGHYAGYSNANQSGNVFIGNNAGRNEAGSNKLYIDNSNTASPLIWGDFSNDQVKINGSLFVSTLPFGDKQNVQWDDATGQFYYDNSSLRYKENIAPLEDDCSKLLDVSPKTYTRPNNPGVYEIGYIAEEFDAAGLNRLVWYDENGRPEGINYDKIVLYTNENVKALKEENRLLKEALSQLDTRVRELEQQIPH
jgi:hypothetical protein